MNNSLNGQEKLRQFRATGPRSGRERSASPHLPAVRGGNQFLRWSITSVPSGTGTSGPPAQCLERRADLHPTLSQAIEEYSRGEISYARALRTGAMFIEGIASLSDTERDGAFLRFSDALDGTDGRREELQRGRRRSPTRREPREGEAGQRDWREHRTRDGRLRISEKECPWYKSGANGNFSLTESQCKTRESLEYFRTDIGLATRWVKSALGAPKYFPESEWKNILCGQSVNLGRVLASQCPSEAREANFLRVENSIDWYLAWAATAEAIAFVFPHRQQELRQYTSYINKKFGARIPASHYQVICFDKAIREAVGGGESSSLLDREIHEDLAERILHADNVDNWGSEDQAHQHQRLCNRFNGKVWCSDSYCRYAHRCRSCKQGDHGQANCQNTRERWIRA